MVNKWCSDQPKRQRVRIAYHNPWIASAENQAFMSLAIAGRRRGIEVVHCATHEELSACKPEFVLSVSSSVAKIVDIPSYLTVHAPKAFFLETPGHLRNLLTYDGYLTISDTLDRFLRDLCFGVGRWERPGFFYNTPQVSALNVDWNAVINDGKLAVAYFGSNWDRRFPDLFRALDGFGIARVHGPEDAWIDEGLKCYLGSVPFDGNAPQRVYAECGMGLALLAEKWRRGDVISNRIFEIVSVGAVAVCPDMPWTRKWFGDSVLYFNPADGPEAIARAVRACYDFCREDPRAAADMGARARAVFEAHFSAEVMLDKLVTYHERKESEVSAATAAMPVAPEISVVLRCGGRAVDFVRRAVDSIRRQTYGSFHIILMKFRDLNLSEITTDLSGAIATFTEVSIPGGDRAEMLFAGVRRVETEYFAVLDDDDFWLSHHFEDLFRAGRAVDPRFDIAFSGSVAFDYPIFYRPTQSCDRNVLLFGFERTPTNSVDIQGSIGTNCFVARRDLLPDELVDVPVMETAEDSLLIALLSRRSKPVFSYRATAFYRRDAEDGSKWATHPNRAEDEDTLQLRVEQMWGARWLAGPSIYTVSPLAPSPPTLEQSLEGVPEPALCDNSLVSSIYSRDNVEAMLLPLDASRAKSIGHLTFLERDGETIIEAIFPEQPWSFGIEIDLADVLENQTTNIVVEFENTVEGFGVGLLDLGGKLLSACNKVPARKARAEMWLRIDNPQNVSQLIVQSWDQGVEAPVALTRVWVASETDAILPAEERRATEIARLRQASCS